MSAKTPMLININDHPVSRSINGKLSDLCNKHRESSVQENRKGSFNKLLKGGFKLPELNGPKSLTRQNTFN